MADHLAGNKDAPVCNKIYSTLNGSSFKTIYKTSQFNGLWNGLYSLTEVLPLFWKLNDQKKKRKKEMDKINVLQEEKG